MGRHRARRAKTRCETSRGELPDARHDTRHSGLASAVPCRHIAPTRLSRHRGALAARHGRCGGAWLGCEEAGFGARLVAGGQGRKALLTAWLGANGLGPGSPAFFSLCSIDPGAQSRQWHACPVGPALIPPSVCPFFAPHPFAFPPPLPRDALSLLGAPRGPALWR